jgi:hypothetical protein
MRTIPVVLFVLSLGVSFAIIGGAGVGASIFGVGSQDAGTQEALDDAQKNTSLNKSDDGGLRGDVQGNNEPTVVGLVLSAGKAVVNVALVVGLLPYVLINLGFPAYFALPVGGFAQVVAGIGVFQFLTGRVWD